MMELGLDPSCGLFVPSCHLCGAQEAHLLWVDAQPCPAGFELL